MTDIHCNNLQQDRNLGEKWERHFCWWAALFKKSFTPMQIGRTKSAQAINMDENFKWNYSTLPDIAIWTSPGEHHEIKHKSPTRYNSFGLEVYRFEALLWFSGETQQKVMYTIHNHALSGGRNSDLNRLEDWITIDIKNLNEKWIGPYNGPSYVNGNTRTVPIYYWSIDLWQPLEQFWASK